MRPIFDLLVKIGSYRNNSFISKCSKFLFCWGILLQAASIGFLGFYVVGGLGHFLSFILTSSSELLIQHEECADTTHTGHFQYFQDLTICKLLNKRTVDPVKSDFGPKDLKWACQVEQYSSEEV